MNWKPVAIVLPIVILVLIIALFFLVNTQKPNIQFDELNFVKWSPISSQSGMNLVAELPQPGFVCYSPGYVSVGDMNISSVDLNGIYIQQVSGGFVVKLIALPSPCHCGEVSSTLMYLFVDPAGHTVIENTASFGEHYEGICAN